MKSFKSLLFTWFARLFHEELNAFRAEIAVTTQQNLAKEFAKREEAIRLEEKEYFETRIEKEVAQQYSRQHWLVDPNRVFLVSSSGVAYLNQEPIDAHQAQKLKEEAKWLMGTDLWQIIIMTLRQKAIEKSVLESKNWEEVLAGKMMIHNLGIIKTLVEYIAKKETLAASSGHKEFMI